jgi:predicted RNase H-like nuclease (RuvC/YqgF family)
MAGGATMGKFDPKKNNSFKSGNSSEVIKDSQLNSAPKKFSLSGILGLNQTVEINKATAKPENWGKEFFGNINLLQQQEKVLFDQHQKELEKTINELRDEIKKLTQSTDNLDKNIQNIPLENIPEASEYQINFLVRIKNFIANFRKNINEAGTWLESFSQKKKKKNYFWNMARDKKKGGDQYLMSNEHSASRSVN